LLHKFSIAGDKSVEFFFSQCKQIAVFDASPTMERDCRNRMSGKIARQPAINAFVEQNGADGISDIEGKIARVATSELGNDRVSIFTPHAQVRFLSPLQEMQSPARVTRSEITRESHRSSRHLPSNQSGSE